MGAVIISHTLKTLKIDFFALSKDFIGLLYLLVRLFTTNHAMSTSRQ